MKTRKIQYPVLAWTPEAGAGVFAETAAADANATATTAAELIAAAAAAAAANATAAASAEHINANLDWFEPWSEPVRRRKRHDYGGYFLSPEGDSVGVFNDSASADADAQAAASAAVTFEAIAADLAAAATVAVLEEHINANLDWFIQASEPIRRRKRHDYGGYFFAEESGSNNFSESASITADGTAGSDAIATFEAVVAAAANATIAVTGVLAGVGKQTPNRIIGGGLWPQ